MITIQYDAKKLNEKPITRKIPNNKTQISINHNDPNFKPDGEEATTLVWML
jgi:hypothetical protein